VCLEGNDVGEEISALKGKVLDDKVKGIVGVLDARDGDISNLFNDLRQDNLADVVPELRFELETAFAVKEQVFGKAGPILSKALIQRIVTHSSEPGANTVKQIVEVGAVLLVIEATSAFAKLPALGIALWFQNKPCLEKYFLDVRVDLREPVTQLGIASRILNQDVHSVDKGVERIAIGKPFKESSEFTYGEVDILVGCDTFSVVASSGSNRPTVLGVLSNIAEEPANRLLVIIMLLAFNDNFLSAVDELIATLLWEIFFR